MPVGVLLIVAMGCVPRSAAAAPNTIGQDAAGSEGIAGGLFWLPLAALAIVLIWRTRWYRVPRALRRPAVFGPGVEAVLVIALILVAPVVALVVGRALGLLPAGEGGEGAAPPGLADQVPFALLTYVVEATVGIAYLWRLADVPDPVPDYRASRPRAAVIGVFGLLLAWPIVTASGDLAALLVVLLGGTPPPEIAHETLSELASSPTDRWFWVMSFLVVIVAPMIEELTYRGLLQDALRRAGFAPWPAIAVTSAFFALMHLGAVSPSALAALFVLALAFGWAFERTGRLTAPVVMHMLFNLANLVVARQL